MIVFDQLVCLSWAAQEFGADFSPEWRAALGNAVDDKIVCVVTYTRHTALDDFDIHLFVAPCSRWMTSEFVDAVFDYPFVQLGATRVSAAAPVGSPLLAVLIELGFKEEGRKRKGREGVDLVMLGMLKEECRYGRNVRRRQENAQSA